MMRPGTGNFCGVLHQPVLRALLGRDKGRCYRPERVVKIERNCAYVFLGH
jgi:hypothetical protein